MDLEKKVFESIKRASDIFESCYKTFDAKIEFLKKVNSDKNYPDVCEFKDKIHEAVYLLGENARESTPRKQQQSQLAELVKKFTSNPTKEELISYFKDNEKMFNVLCLMYVHFNQTNLPEKAKESHKFMLGPMEECVKKLIA